MLVFIFLIFGFNLAIYAADTIFTKNILDSYSAPNPAGSTIFHITTNPLASKARDLDHHLEAYISYDPVTGIYVPIKFEMTYAPKSLWTSIFNQKSFATRYLNSHFFPQKFKLGLMDISFDKQTHVKRSSGDINSDALVFKVNNNEHLEEIILNLSSHRVHLKSKIPSVNQSVFTLENNLNITIVDNVFETVNLPLEMIRMYVEYSIFPHEVSLSLNIFESNNSFEISNLHLRKKTRKYGYNYFLDEKISAESISFSRKSSNEFLIQFSTSEDNYKFLLKVNKKTKLYELIYIYPYPPEISRKSIYKEMNVSAQMSLLLSVFKHKNNGALASFNSHQFYKNELFPSAQHSLEFMENTNMMNRALAYSSIHKTLHLWFDKKADYSQQDRQYLKDFLDYISNSNASGLQNFTNFSTTELRELNSKFRSVYKDQNAYPRLNRMIADFKLLDFALDEFLEFFIRGSFSFGNKLCGEEFKLK